MLNKVMTLKEAANRWGMSNKTLTSAILGQKGYAPKFKSDEVNKSEGTWLIKEDAMMRVYGFNAMMIDEAVASYPGTIQDTDWITQERYVINGEEVAVLDYSDGEEYAYYCNGEWCTDQAEAEARSILHENGLERWQSIDYFTELSEDKQQAILTIAGLELGGYADDTAAEHYISSTGKEYYRNSLVAYDYEAKKIINVAYIDEVANDNLEGEDNMYTLLMLDPDAEGEGGFDNIYGADSMYMYMEAYAISIQGLYKSKKEVIEAVRGFLKEFNFDSTINRISELSSFGFYIRLTKTGDKEKFAETKNYYEEFCKNC